MDDHYASCREHDTPENRQAAHRAAQERRDKERMEKVERQKRRAAAPRAEAKRPDDPVEAPLPGQLVEFLAPTDGPPGVAMVLEPEKPGWLTVVMLVAPDGSGRLVGDKFNVRALAVRRFRGVVTLTQE